MVMAKSVVDTKQVYNRMLLGRERLQPSAVQGGWKTRAQLGNFERGHGLIPSVKSVGWLVCLS